MIFSWARVAAFFAGLTAAGWALYPSEYFRGQMHRQQGDRSASIAFFRDYLARNPRHKGATIALAQAYEAAGRPDDGIPVLTEFYRNRRGDFESGLAVIRLMERCMLRKEAADFRWELIADLRAMPHADLRRIEQMLYEAYQRSAAAQDDEGTLRALTDLAGLGVKDSGYRDQVLRLFLARGQLDRALAMLRESSRAEPRNVELRRALIRLQHMRGDPRAALDEAKQALSVLPDDTSLLGDRVAILMAEKRWNEAEADLRKLMERQPREAAWPREYARCLIEQGRIEDGARILDRLVRDNPSDPERWRALVYAYTDRGWYGDAAGVLARMHQRFPGDDEVFDDLVQANQNAERGDEAVRLLRLRLERSPDDWARRRRLVSILREAERYAEAAEEYRFMTRSFPDEPENWKSLAYIQQVSGAKADAAETLRGYLARFPDDRQTASKLAVLLVELGDKRGAIEVLRGTFAPLEPGQKGGSP